MTSAPPPQVCELPAVQQVLDLVILRHRLQEVQPLAGRGEGIDASKHAGIRIQILPLGAI